VVVEAPVFEEEGKIRPQTAGGVHALGLTPNAGRRKLYYPTILCAGAGGLTPWRETWAGLWFWAGAASARPV
jgi:hypothetical protein